MHILQKFLITEKVEMIEQHGIPFYNGIQVCQLLGFTNNRTAIQRYTLKRETAMIQTQNKRSIIFVDISGFFALAMQSKRFSDEEKGDIRDELLWSLTE
jgi:prophage antirepressor-like protein